MRTIKVSIDTGGKTKVEFVGFIGDACSDERERLEKVLTAFGVDLQVVELKRKPSGQIAAEISGVPGEQTGAKSQHEHGT